jgi:hypothetical protein
VAGGEGADRVRHRSACLRYVRALLGAHGLTIAQWQGRYLVGNGRGRTVVVDDLAACWAAAAQIAGVPIDPLEPRALAALRRAARR